MASVLEAVASCGWAPDATTQQIAFWGWARVEEWFWLNPSDATWTTSPTVSATWTTDTPGSATWTELPPYTPLGVVRT